MAGLGFWQRWSTGVGVAGGGECFLAVISRAQSGMGGTDTVPAWVHILPGLRQGHAPLSIAEPWECAGGTGMRGDAVLLAPRGVATSLG